MRPCEVMLLFEILVGLDRSRSSFNWDSETFRTSRKYLLTHGLIDETQEQLTQKGRALVDMVCATPLPDRKSVV